MHYIIKEHINIFTARKDVCVDGTPYSGEPDQVSEWANAMAFSCFPIGTRLSESEVRQLLKEWLLNQHLFSLAHQDLIDMFWNGETVVFKYKNGL